MSSPDNVAGAGSEQRLSMDLSAKTNFRAGPDPRRAAELNEDRPASVATGARSVAAARHVVHILPSFGIGGVPLRVARIINHFGTRLRHTIIALDRDFAAAGSLIEGLDVGLVDSVRTPHGAPRRIFDNARELRRLRPDLLATYNWGAIEWAMANRLRPVAPHLHFEDGFGQQEADRQIRRRVLFRRWALAGCLKVVVPSQKLVELARDVWRLRTDCIALIPNGVDIDRFANPPRDAIPGLVRRPQQLVIGTVAPLRPEKNIARLLRVFAALNEQPEPQLVIAGEGTEGSKLGRLAAEFGISSRVLFTGRVAPEAVLGSFDIFALSSDTEQMPITLLEAMAASRAVAAVDVGDVKRMVCGENREFIVPRDDIAAFAAAMSALLRDPSRRAELGRRNRERVQTAFSQEQMFAGYAGLFGLADGA